MFPIAKTNKYEIQNNAFIKIFTGLILILNYTDEFNTIMGYLNQLFGLFWEEFKHQQVVE